jgi:TonB-dependent starch-binding outer membrane protein SusC
MKNTLCKASAYVWTPFSKTITRVMKITAFILLAFCLQVSAKVSSQTVTLSAKNVTIKEVFRQIILQTGISVIYDNAIIDKIKPVNIDVKNASINEVLDLCLAGQPITYKHQGNSIMLKFREGTLDKDKKVTSTNL